MRTEFEDMLLIGGVTALSVTALLRLRHKIRRAFSGGGIVILDLRDKSRLTDKAASRTKLRDIEDVNGQTLHQMGFSRGNDPDRYLRITSHYAILPDGTILWLHGPEVYLPAADGFSRHTESVEYVGNLPNVPGSTDPADYWAPDRMGMNQLTVPQAISGRYLLAKRKRELGLRYVLAHKQADGGKVCPGGDVWAAVGVYGARHLGLSTDGLEARFGTPGGEGSVLPKGTPGGHGAPLPASWWDAADAWDARIAAA